MTNEDLKREIVKEIRSFQTKFIYYVIALNIASVGYTIHFIQGQSFNYSHYLLGVAIFFWSTGVYLGFQFLFRHKQVVHISYNILETIDLLPPDLINRVTKQINTESHSIQERAERFYKWSLFSFYIGCLLFVVWQVVQMIYFVDHSIPRLHIKI